MGIFYNETADTWSFACMIYEMLTGDFLFAPQKTETYSKSEDHLALVDLCNLDDGGPPPVPSRVRHEGHAL